MNNVHPLLASVRFIQIHAFPGSAIIGHIRHGVPDSEIHKELASYPSVYRQLAWYERRLIHELPTFVKLVSTPITGGYYVVGDHLKIDYWIITCDPVSAICKTVAKIKGAEYNPADLLPVTEDEYNNAPYNMDRGTKNESHV